MPSMLVALAALMGFSLLPAAQASVNVAFGGPPVTVDRVLLDTAGDTLELTLFNDTIAVSTKLCFVCTTRQGPCVPRHAGRLHGRTVRGIMRMAGPCLSRGSCTNGLPR